ncbi:MAG TPA: RDD family protein, partial [Thermoanaerobaculia bacterium]
MGEARRERILGLDNIRLDLPVASVGSRSLAVLLDYLVLAVVLVAWVFGAGVGLAAVAPDLAIVLVVTGLFLLQWGYFAGQEIATRGRTLGKRALGLRVVT